MPRKSVRARRRSKPSFYYYAFMALGCAAVALVLMICVSAYIKNVIKRQDQPVLIAETLPPESTEEPLVIGGDGFFDESEPEPTATAEPESEPVSLAESVRPTVSVEGYLPVFEKANITEPKIAIIVDECGSVGVTKNFCETALKYGAKLTLFPVGEFLTAPGMELLFPTIVHEYGFEVENRGWHGMGRVYRMDDETLVDEIWDQNKQLNMTLNEKYTMHFFRPFGGTGIEDAHVQYILKQMGYYGTVGWSVMGSTLDTAKLPDIIAPGQIYYFKTSESDLKKMEALMTYARDHDYQMVTLNALFGFEENACEYSDDLIFGQKTPKVEPYTPMIRMLVDGECSYDVYLMQKRLAELNYTDAEPDGVYGTGTSNALRLFQNACGMAATGIADESILERLYSEDAPVRGEEVLLK